MNYPKTRKEAKQLSVPYYFTGIPCKHGHIALRKTKGACVECIKAAWQASAEKRADYFTSYNKSERGKESKKRYYARNTELVKTRALSRPPEIINSYRKKWAEANPESVREHVKQRRRMNKKATPAWLTSEQKAEMKQMYLDAVVASRITGIRYVVDHIYPIQGEFVCGLHVPGNLQIITLKENSIKHNKMPL